MSIAMKTLEKGSDKIQKICDKIKNDTLQPAINEAASIVEKARQEAFLIVEEGKKQALLLEQKAKALMEKERAMCHASLQQAAKQAIEALRQDISKALFNQAFDEQIAKVAKDPKIIARLIEVIIQAVDREGLGAQFQVILPKQIPAKEVSCHLSRELVKKLSEEDISHGPFIAGAQVKVKEGNFTVDVSEEALKELFTGYLSKDFRHFMFGG
ncbi:MAG: ntpE [Chlamydiales bacterium]|jgi:V/A-type H+-transporting ATPase subunit E|nr:ntpE [Chlamydiales bacterium]